MPKGKTKGKANTECSKRKESSKRKVGRPKKVRTNTECSINKNSSPEETSPKKRRGRPPKTNPSTESFQADLSNVKYLKVLGYCTNTECSCSITNHDYEEGKKTILICVRCGTRQRISQLRENLEGPVKKVSKKKFLNDITYEAPTTDEEAYHHEINVPEEFKAFQIDADEWES
jgi:hypothetical protein